MRPLRCAVAALALLAGSAAASPELALQLRQVVDSARERAMGEYRDLLSDSAGISGTVELQLQVDVDGRLVWIGAEAEPPVLLAVAESLRVDMEGIVLQVDSQRAEPLDVVVPLSFMPPEE